MLVAIFCMSLLGLTLDGGVAAASDGSHAAVPAKSAAAARLGGAPVVPAAFAGTHLKKAQSNLCLVARLGPGERPVEQTVCGDLSDQGWDFIYVTYQGVVYNQIHNLDRNLCIVTRGGGESRAVVTGCALFADQLWSASWDSKWQGYRFQNANSHLCLVARGTSPAVQSICGDFSDQVWQLYP